MTRLHHYDNLGTARFVTFSCYRRLPSLADIRAKEVLVEHLQTARKKHGFKLLGYVIMLEHVHLVLCPPSGMKLGLVIREIKSRSARQFFAESAIDSLAGKRVFWQRRCYDHNCRTLETVIEKIQYCHDNPVKRGLVNDPGDWRWSSYNWYRGLYDVPLKMDSIQL